MAEKVTKRNMAELTKQCFEKTIYMVGEGKLPNGGEEVIHVEGITREASFHGKRLNEHRCTVQAILRKLPDCFESSSGASFEEMAFTKGGKERWTAKPYVCEQLLLMAMALGLMRYTTPRNCWGRFEGKDCDIPYVAIVA